MLRGSKMSEDFKDLKAFGEEVGLKDDAEAPHDSPYALLIEDIDRQQDRELVYEVLSQSGVDLDLESIKKQLGEGHLLVSHLNQAKAAIMVDQIKRIEADKSGRAS